MKYLTNCYQPYFKDLVSNDLTPKHIYFNA